MNIRIERIGNKTKIYFNDILHIRAEILAIHSWKVKAERLHYIEYVFKNGSIIANYDREEHWLEILRQLDKII